MEISSIYTREPKTIIICYTVPKIWCMTDYFSFWATFCPFTPLTPQNTKKKHLEISLFYTSVPNIMIICYNVPEIGLMTDVIVMFHFGLFFALLLLTAQTKNENLKKMKKAAADIIILHKCTKNHDHMLYCS